MNIQQEIVNYEAWIIDGNNTKSLETRYSKADLCLYFNLPKIICLWRIFKRIFHDRSHIDDRAEGCKETIRWNLIKYMWYFERRVSKSITELQVKYPSVKFIEVNKQSQIQEILDAMRQ
jgi:adenylate kinase family enzyme